MKTSKDTPAYDLHRFRKKIIGKRMPQWPDLNEKLEKRAWGGDDEAFFRLIESDPEYLKTDLAMERIFDWRFVLDLFEPWDGAHQGCMTSRQELAEIQEEINRARENLFRIGRALAYDITKYPLGVRSFPPLIDVCYTHMGFVSLFKGIKKAYRIKRKTQHANFNRHVLDFIQRFRRDYSDRFKPVCDAIDAFEKWHGLNEETIQDIIQQKPSIFAIELTAKCCGVNKKKIEKILKRSKDDIRYMVFAPIPDNIFEEASKKEDYEIIRAQFFPLILKEFENLIGIAVD